METQRTTGAPGWREQRHARIARQKKKRLERVRAQQRARASRGRSRDNDDEDEDEERPQQRQSKKRSPGVASSRGGHHTHLVSKGGIIGATIFALRAIAVLLVLASAFGNYVQFAGGWPQQGQPLPMSEAIVLYAVGYQLLCSVFQWGFKAMAWWPLYGLALIASAVPSYLTYSAWVGPWLAPQIGTSLALVAIGIATLAADALPEWVLVG
jgi:hypothetical protein